MKITLKAAGKGDGGRHITYIKTNKECFITFLQNRGKRNTEQIREIENKQQDGRLKSNHANIYIKWKWSKNSNWKAEKVRLNNKARHYIVYKKLM